MGLSGSPPASPTADGRRLVPVAEEAELAQLELASLSLDGSQSPRLRASYSMPIQLSPRGSGPGAGGAAPPRRSASADGATGAATLAAAKAAPPAGRSLRGRARTAWYAVLHIWWGLPTACKGCMVMAGACGGGLLAACCLCGAPRLHLVRAARCLPACLHGAHASRAAARPACSSRLRELPHACAASPHPPTHCSHR